MKLFPLFGMTLGVLASLPASATITPINPLGAGNGGERCLIGTNCSGGSYNGKPSILSIIEQDVGAPLVRVDDGLDKLWQNLIDNGGEVLGRARYAGDRSELGYATGGPGTYVKLLDAMPSKTVYVDDSSLTSLDVTGDIKTYPGAATWQTINLNAGVPFAFVLNNISSNFKLTSNDPGSAGYANILDQMVTWRVQTDDGSLHYIIAWEDRIMSQNAGFASRTLGGNPFRCAGADCDFNDFVAEVRIATVPEPSTYVLLAVGVIGIGFSMRNQQRRTRFQA